MSVLKVVKYPSKILSKSLSPVEHFNSELKEVVRDMFETMYTYNGIGLAANQVGLDKRIVIVDISSKENKTQPLVLVNPYIINYSKKKVWLEEGCLSFPGVFDKVSRPHSIQVVYHDINGKKREITADGLLARVIQHEIDHINGIKFIQRMSLNSQIKFYLLYSLGKYKF